MSTSKIAEREKIEQERAKVEQELAEKRKTERNAILKQVKVMIHKHEIKRKLYPLFEIKDKTAPEESREYSIRKRPGKHFFDKSSYFKINTGPELITCLKSELKHLRSEAEFHPDKGFVKIIDDKSVHDFFQSCLNNKQIVKIQSKTGEKIPKTERTKIRRTVNFYKGIRDAGKFHVFYEHPEQNFTSGEFDRYVWMEDDRATWEDWISWGFFGFSCLMMVKAFFPDFFWAVCEWLALGLLYCPVIVICGLFALNCAARCLSVIMYAASKGKTCKIFFPNLYKGNTFLSMFKPVSVKFEPNPEIGHFSQIMSLLGKYKVDNPSAASSMLNELRSSKKQK